MKNLKNKKIIITGASSGIGKALAFELAEKGAHLVLTSRKIELLQKTADEIKATFPDSPKPVSISCDISKKEEVKQLIKESINQLGEIDILINNAGIGVYGDIEKTTEEDYRKIMDVNYFGPIYSMFEILPYMKQRKKGMIINVTSLAAIYSVPYLGAYSASKAALVSLTQNLRAELSDSGVSFMIVYPGYTQTDFFKNEKKTGGARRPSGKYMPARKVAKGIVRAIEKGKQDLIFTASGKALAIFQGIAPWLVRKVMREIADNLCDKKEA